MDACAMETTSARREYAILSTFVKTLALQTQTATLQFASHTTKIAETARKHTRWESTLTFALALETQIALLATATLHL